MTPRVSICVPNLNTRRFLAERFATIQDQSLGDWELLVYDSYSDDGAWEYIVEMAGREPRMQIWQGPREGTPGSWTPCIREARGEYVYIATSDDTMASDCLAKLVAALDARPDCDLAHCTLRAIDEHGRDITEMADWWSSQSSFALSSGALLNQRHVRRAPFDGLLHLLGGSVYLSITQLLIRRSLFDRIGWFERTWGSVGDFNWSMRAALAANAVHVPDTWGGWRIHSTQATAGAALGSTQHAEKIDGMIDHAIAASEHFLTPSLRQHLVDRWAPEARAYREFMRTVAQRSHRPPRERRAFLLRQIWSGSAPAREYVTSRLLRRPPTDWVRRCLHEAGVAANLIPFRPQVTVATNQHVRARQAKLL